MKENKIITDIIDHDMSLEDTISEPTEQELEKGTELALEQLTKATQLMYSHYNFRRFDPNKDDTESANSLTFKLTGVNNEYTEILAHLFKIFFDYKLNALDISKAFKERIKQGKVLKLGNVEIINVLVSNPLQSPDINIIIDFMLTDKYNKLQESKEKQKEKINKIKEKTKNNE